MIVPEFPDFKELEQEDREFLHPRIWRFQPQTSELTFNNFYLWRSYYGFEWSVLDDTVLVVAHGQSGGIFGYPPIGAGSRGTAAERFLMWMQSERGESHAVIARADESLAVELEHHPRFLIQETRDQFDYVYRTEDLGELAGRKYSAKRNHINQFTRAYQYEYQPITPDLVDACLALAEVWCEQRLCEEDLSLQHELCGIQDALANFEALELDGGALLVQGQVQAFALGELLNETTAVIHIEKANPEYRGIYPMMTKTYSSRWLGLTSHISMEQDLGEPGLRRAKESYYPDYLAKKYEIRLAE
ncbi:MAG: phosphatidylglycerol lysyltransferase domain-containing protein [Anaerolineae bacterium]|jgi:hypothetical protein|nr:phosphatidylglycerol lysyltransferase domain-containing protein [Anaerolineae bacterium]